MKVIGLFRELVRSANMSSLGIRDLVGKLPAQETPAIAAYLKSGVTVLDVMSSEWDPLDKDVVIPGAPSLISDGYWVWRHDLSYYVDRYKIGLDPEFVQMVINNEKSNIVESEVLSKLHTILKCYEDAHRKFEL